MIYIIQQQQQKYLSGLTINAATRIEHLAEVKIRNLPTKKRLKSIQL